MTDKERDEALFVRNKRPNRVNIWYAGTVYKLHHRGHREDSTSLPVDAANDPTVARWLRQGVLEKISKDTFMKLASRTVDIVPNQFLKSPRVGKGSKGVAMVADETDTTKARTQLADTDSRKGADPSLTWAGDLMTTEEEIAEYRYDSRDGQANYPSKHRDDSEEARRRQLGY